MNSYSGSGRINERVATYCVNFSFLVCTLCFVEVNSKINILLN